MTMGFEPMPLRTSALSWRLRPLGQIIACLELFLILYDVISTIRAEGMLPTSERSPCAVSLDVRRIPPVILH